MYDIVETIWYSITYICEPVYSFLKKMYVDEQTHRFLPHWFSAMFEKTYKHHIEKYIPEVGAVRDIGTFSSLFCDISTNIFDLILKNHIQNTKNMI